MTEVDVGLTAVADGLGLQSLSAFQPGCRALEGWLMGCRVRLAIRHTQATRWLVVSMRDGPRVGPFRFEPHRPWPSRRRRSRTLTGDLRFDARVLVYGAPGLVAGHLGSRVRAHCLELLAPERAVLWSGRAGLRYALVDDPPPPERLALIRRFVGGWPLWAPDETSAVLAERWVDNATTDPDRRVRAINARRFLRSDRQEHAAMSKGLVRLARSSGLSLPIREEAALALARTGAGVRALTRLLDLTDVRVVRTAVTLLVERHTDPVPDFARALAVADGAVAILLAEALAVHEDERAVPALVGLLGRSDPQLQAAAFDALGRTGTPAVAPLLSTEIRRRAPGCAQTAAHRALRALQARYPDPAAWRALEGALSLFSSAHGEVSLSSADSAGYEEQG